MDQCFREWAPPPGSQAGKITVITVLQPVLSPDRGAGCESFLLGAWPWLTSTVCRSVAEQKSWLKKLEIKRRVADHMTRGCWWNETCKTSQGAFTRAYIHVHTLRDTALTVLPEDCQMTSDLRSGYSYTRVQRLQPAACLQKLTNWLSIWHTNMSFCKN